MSGLANAGSAGPLNATPTQIVNQFSAGAQITVAIGPTGLASILSGALVANTLATVLNLNGAGVLEFLAGVVLDATARTMRLQLILDGVIVFDATSSAVATAGNGQWIVGAQQGGAVTVLGQVPFKKSCVLKMASSLTENNTMRVLTAYRMT
ncbi:MAG: hypothetical protein ACJ8LG_21650 [Massilia sp.]